MWLKEEVMEWHTNAQSYHYAGLLSHDEPLHPIGRVALCAPLTPVLTPKSHEKGSRSLQLTSSIPLGRPEDREVPFSCPVRNLENAERLTEVKQVLQRNTIKQVKCILIFIGTYICHRRYHKRATLRVFPCVLFGTFAGAHMC